MKTQFTIPDVGCRVAITFEFPSYVIGAPKVNKTTITGVVEKATKFTPPNFVRLATDFDSPVRVREIPVERITGIEYADGRDAPKEKILGDVKSWTVQGSRGNNYVVVRTIQRWSCTCPGFAFRKTCKHIKELQDA
jgi:hypothetical protein